MEKLLETGKCKAIGVSNFSIKTYVLQSTIACITLVHLAPQQIGKTLHDSQDHTCGKSDRVSRTSMFVFLQIDLLANRLHPYLVQEELVQYCREKGIVVVAYTPTGLDVIRKDPVIIELAEKYNSTPTQVILAWHLARGVVAVPKSADEGRQKENRMVGLPSLFRYKQY